MVCIYTHGIDNTHGIDLDSWYRIGTTESHTYERAECYPYAGFFFNLLALVWCPAELCQRTICLADKEQEQIMRSHNGTDRPDGMRSEITAVQCSEMQYSAVHFSAVQYSTVQ